MGRNPQGSPNPNPTIPPHPWNSCSVPSTHFHLLFLSKFIFLYHWNTLCNSRQSKLLQQSLETVDFFLLFSQFQGIYLHLPCLSRFITKLLQIKISWSVFWGSHLRAGIHFPEILTSPFFLTPEGTNIAGKWAKGVQDLRERDFLWLSCSVWFNFPTEIKTTERQESSYWNRSCRTSL